MTDAINEPLSGIELLNTDLVKFSINEHWLVESLDKFAEVMYFQENQDLATWGDLFLQKLMPFIGGLQAILYTKNNDKLNFTSSYALDDFSKKTIKIAIGDGLIGEAIKNNEMCYLSDVDIHYQSHLSTVNFAIQAIVVLPLSFNKNVCGALEILFHKKPQKQYIDLLQRLGERIAANLNIMLIMNRLEDSHKEIEAKNYNIMGSINYAKRIQDVFLPSITQQLNIFPNSFVIYKPLHVVSGDFYWISQHGNLKIACVIDCTGHGIPAAFLSLLGNSLLNEAIIQNHILSPSLIVAWLHRGIQQRLQSGEDKLKDGMDLGICIIEYLDNQQVKLIYEGAKHTLFLTRDGKVERHNSSRLILGYSEHVFHVEDKEIMLSPNDMIYLTTDGYIDQANTKRQRLGSAKFSQLVAEHHGKSIQEQQDIFEEIFVIYSNGEPQRDDITVLGIQL
jgi:serine phosphatase RsbU (regulator of sigma subunit)